MDPSSQGPQPSATGAADAGKVAKTSSTAAQLHKTRPTSARRAVSSVSMMAADDGDDVSIASLSAPYRDKLRSIKLELNRHKGIIASTSVAAFAFATYFLVVATCMLLIHGCSSKADTSVAIKMGFNPINIAVTLMAMGVGCATLAMSLAYSIEDVNWA